MFRQLAVPVARSVLTRRMFSQLRLPVAAFAASMSGRTTPMRFVSHAELHDCASSELAEERSRTDKNLPAVPQGWKLTHASGDSFFQMTRQFQDETHDVYCRLQPKDPEVAERANDQVVEHFPFQFYVSKGKQTLEFSLTSVDNELVVDGVATFDDPNLAKDMSAASMSKRDHKYQGPAIHELDSRLVNSIIQYLDQRGVNDEFAQFVAEYSYWMEQTEYEGWLQNVANFAK